MSQLHVLTYAATLRAFADTFLRLRRILADWKLASGPAYRCEVVFEEVCVNIIKHAYRDAGPHEIRVTVVREQDAVVFRFEDDGIAFDPTRVPAMPVPSRAEPAIGGRGLLLVSRLAGSLAYERTPQGINRLTVRIPA